MDDQRPPAPRLRREQIPNLLTLLRVALAAVFFVLLALYEFPRSGDGLLLAATALFVVAALTDAVDGHLARKWNAVSAFGRVMDPFADKILVLGAFVMLAGANFASFSVHGEHAMTTGVRTWMVVVILARELLVTSLRGILESRGVSFGAIGAGKIKMAAQSVAVPLILVCVVAQSGASPDGARTWRTVAAITAWATTLLTAWSAVPYIARGWRVIAPPTD